jgi:hypothetical protein
MISVAYLELKHIAVLFWVDIFIREEDLQAIKLKPH